MELNLKITLLILSILFTGLTAGLCFTWSNAITPGLSRLNDIGFLKAFQAMNRAIINPSFLVVFLGPVILLFINAYFHRQGNAMTFWSFAIAAILFFLGIGIITVFKNVPLNEVLDKAVLENLSDIECKELRKNFEQPWKRWHMIRTICSCTSFVLLVTGLIHLK